MAACQTPPTGAEPFLVGFDIETDTSVDGLDSANSAIVAVAITTPDADSVFQGDEATILRRANDLIAGLPSGYLVTWNGSTFDLPFVRDRAAMLGIEIDLALQPSPKHSGNTEREAVIGTWANLTHLDGWSLYDADVGRNLKLPCGLKPLARLVGLEPVELDRSRIHEASPEELDAYVASDARVAVELVSRRLPHSLQYADKQPARHPQFTLPCKGVAPMAASGRRRVQS